MDKEQLKRTYIKFEDAYGNTWSIIYMPEWDGPLERYLKNPYYTVYEE